MNEADFKEQVSFWKERAARAEKECKSHLETIECIKKHAVHRDNELVEWKQRALRAEYIISLRP